jgi:tetratricopeptide (TPR) repeat protein
LAEKQPDRPEGQSALASSYKWIGVVLRTQGKLADAEKAQKQALAILERLVQQEPDHRGWQSELARVHENLAEVAWHGNDLAAALSGYRRAVGLLETLTRQDPANAEWHRHLARNICTVAIVHKNRGEGVQAVESLERALRIAIGFARLDPGNMDWERQVLQCRLQLSTLRGSLREQWTAQRELHRVAWTRAKKDPAHALWQRDLAGTKQALAWSLMELAQREEAPWLPREGASTVAQLAPLPGHRPLTALCILAALRASRSVEQGEQADTLLKEALGIQRRLVQDDPNNREFLTGLSALLLEQARFLRMQGNETGAKAAEAEALQTR